jgi:diguanylate cyclase (GGDEF)-like protein
VGTSARLHRASAWYVAAIVAGAAVHQVLPAAARPTWFTVMSSVPVVPLALLLRRSPRAERPPWWLLLTAQVVLAVGNAAIAVGGAAYRHPVDVVQTVGHALLLCAALALAVRRGRNDIGGLTDAAVALMGLSGLIWSCLLQPRLAAAQVALGAQAQLLVSIIVLTGVLGALGRLWVAARPRLAALQLLIVSLLLALAGNVVLAMRFDGAVSHWPPWVEALFIVAYGCVGAATLHPSGLQLSRPGPVPVDHLSGGRLVFLGAAIVVTPVVGGGRVLLGLPADGLLIALGTLAVAPLVMLRIHRLAAQRADAERALLHQATHDPLTGLPNRAELHARLGAALAAERAAGRLGVVLLFCDLNGFKGVNDRLGHAAGDDLLVQVATRLRGGLRAGDTVARYGGDEFLLLCTDTAQATAVARLYTHVQDSLRAPFDIGGERVELGGSVGAIASDGVTSADELIRRADEAMYQAKQVVRRPVPQPGCRPGQPSQPQTRQATPAAPAAASSPR